MKKSELKIGYVIEIKDGRRLIIGINDTSNCELLAKKYVDELGSFCTEYSLYNILDENLKIKNNKYENYEVVKVWSDKKALFDYSIKPTWERKFLDDLKYNSPIWVRDENTENWQIALFKEEDDETDAVIAGFTKECNGSLFYQCKEFKMSDLEVE